MTKRAVVMNPNGGERDATTPAPVAVAGTGLVSVLVFPAAALLVLGRSNIAISVSISAGRSAGLFRQFGCVAADGAWQGAPFEPLQ